MQDLFANGASVNFYISVEALHSGAYIPKISKIPVFWDSDVGGGGQYPKIKKYKHTNIFETLGLRPPPEKVPKYLDLWYFFVFVVFSVFGSLWE